MKVLKAEKRKIEAQPAKRRLENSLTRSGLSEQIVESLQRAILGGVFKPGDPLVERQLAQEFQVSSIPIREALQELASRGLVTKHRNRGCRVTQLSEDDIRQLVQLRAYLEPKLLEWAARNLTAEMVAKLKKQLDLLTQAAEANSLPDFFVYDLGFHRMLWHFSGNRYAAAALEATLVPLFAAGQMTYEYDRMLDLKKEAAKHHHILDCIVGGDVAQACEMLLGIAQGFERHLVEDKARRKNARER
jgi:DNA-binding GntR family transcriptional regulator